MHAPCKYEIKSDLSLRQVTAELLSCEVDYSPVCLLRKSEVCESFESVGFDLIQPFFCIELWTMYTKVFSVFCFLTSRRQESCYGL